MVKVSVKWGDKTFDVEVNTSESAEVFRLQLQSLTNVPAERQKIMGVKGGSLKDDADMAALGLKEGQKLMLVGSAEAAVTAPAEAIVFAEDHATGHGSLEISGLNNLGNTCYMNAALQVLHNVAPLRPALARGRTPLEATVSSLFSSLDTSRKALAPMAVLASLISQYPQFGELSERGMPMQHDSQEALSSVLQNVSATVEGTPDLAKYNRLFSGILQQRTVPLGVEGGAAAAAAVAEESVPFSVFGVNILPGQETLEMNMESSLKSAAPEGGPPAEIISRFSALPEVLFLHMRRFTWRRDTDTKTKVLARVAFPMILDVAKLCTEDLQRSMEVERATIKERRDKAVEERKRKRQQAATGRPNEEPEEEADPEPAVLGNTNAYYELCGVVTHKGRDADHGHYVAWCKRKNGWSVYDDNNTAAVTDDNILELCGGPPEAHMAYILVYRSRNPTNFRPPLQM